ncbi:MAG: LysM peptidoglycan-binding domain-containing protein, partial [Lachnospiraceae bacterium]|nr:LysM peptidoglycan-binding domain-containing protein [Lachnospiraceae bacterium]
MMKKSKEEVIGRKFSMLMKSIRKFISIIVVSSLILCNVCTRVEAKDLELAYIYILDAIEDIEYKERESSYRDEHLSFLSENIEDVKEEENEGESYSNESNDIVDSADNTDNTLSETDGLEEQLDETNDNRKEVTERKAINADKYNEEEIVVDKNSDEEERTEEAIDDEVEETTIDTTNEEVEEREGNEIINEKEEAEELDETIEEESEEIVVEEETETNNEEEATLKEKGGVHNNISTVSNVSEEERIDNDDNKNADNKKDDEQIDEETFEGEKKEPFKNISTPSEIIENYGSESISTLSEVNKNHFNEEIATKSNSFIDSKILSTASNIATNSEVIEIRNPEKFYNIRNAEMEIEGVLVSYDKYSRTYLVEEDIGTNEDGEVLNRYVKFIGAGRYYVDDLGNLREMDNTLIKKEEEVKPKRFKLFSGLFSGRSEENSEDIYVNKEGNSKVELSSNGNLGYSIKNGEYAIRVIPIDGEYKDSIVIDNAIRYSNVFKDIDVQYSIVGDNVKEDIILLEKSDINEFSYKLELNGLNAKKGESSIVIFNEEGKVLFNLTAPYIIDNSGIRSSDIEIKYDEEEKIVTYVASKEFLEEASYPVRIDPSASVVVENSAIQMYLLMDGRTKNGNMPAAKNQYIPKASAYYYPGIGYRGDVGYCRQMIYIVPEAITNIGEAQTVDFTITTLGCDTNGQIPFVVKQITNPWDLNTITWNSMEGLGLESTAIWNGKETYSEGAMEEMTFDITSYYRSWVLPETDLRKKEKLGLILMSKEEPAYDGHIFSSVSRSETFFTDAIYGPRIQYGYVSPNVNQDLFLYDVSESYFELGAATKKSSRGGMTTSGVVIFGLTQSGSGGPKTRYTSTTCTRQSRHKVVFKLHKENGAVVFTSENTPASEILYPNYKLVDTLCKDYKYKDYNVQSDAIKYGSVLQLNTIYYATAKASGCSEYEEDSPDDYEGPMPYPLYCKHKGGQVYNTSTGTSSGEVPIVDDSRFLLYKVKFGDTVEKIAGHYQVDVEDIAYDNHFKKLMCYEGDILFIRNPGTSEPYENDLPPELLNKLKELIDVLGYDYEEVMCAYGLEPVNMSTGDFYLEHTDFSIKELGNSEFKISRSYNSIGRIIKSDFGYGFNSIINDRLMVNSDGTIMHFAADGGGETYRKGNNGDYIASKGYNILRPVKDLTSDTDEFEFEFNEDDLEDEETNIEDTFIDNIVSGSNNWKLIYEDGKVATYNSYGSLLTKTDKMGHTYTYNYDSRYRVSSIVSPSGLVVRISYNDKNLISRITLPDSTSINYEYDTNKNLIKVIDQEGRAIRYEYDSDHKMIAWYDADNIRQVLNTYDSEGRVIKQVDANLNEGTISYYADRTILIDNEGNEQVFMLDNKKRNTKKFFGISSVEAEYSKIFTQNSKIDVKTDGNGVKTTYTYDVKGNVLKEEKTDGDFSICKYYTYDINNNK